MSSPGDTLPDVTSWENVHHGVSNGDFARLVPHSPAARRLFGQVVRLLESDSSKLHHVRQYIHYEVTLSSESTAESSFAASTPSPQREALQEFCGYYRLNMSIPPASQGLGWVVGSSRLNKPDHFVDFLLAPFTTENSLHSRHCRLRRQLETGVMVAVSDGRKITVDSRTFQRDDIKQQHERDFQATLQHGTSVRLGDLTYVLVYTDLSQEQKQRELEEALAQVNAMPPNSVMLLSPTPSKPTIDYHGYSIYDADHHGATSSVSLGFDKSNGKPVAVKMVKCTASQFGDLRREIGILSRISHENVCKLLEVVNWDASANPHEWRQNECLTVGLIMSPPATSSALQLLPTWKRLPESTTFLRESIRQIGSGLAHIHSLNILHRDIKPENIGYRSESPVHVIILDFGCSDQGPHSTRHNRGTMTYLAPEVMRIKEEESSEPFSFPSDVWSLGVTLVDFLTGKQVHRKLGQASVYKSFRDIMDTTAARVDYREFWDIAIELLAWEAELRPTAEQLAQRFSHEKQNESEVSRQPSQSEEQLAKRVKV